ncbi:MAG: HAMP domain-containing sensor histidine kinase [Sulfurimonas sp.]|uniref:sensor histidine kinase n=1 Tax=Sulfurimonas sp. TaxID=2022749 RepID=UPI0025E55E02|nr:HAMP domain-containing sensor histidine kinase [Sulfurimonas sp.]MCK9455247.1 HAMP domain-containing histidine kinase [Sulfurimonas sp.]
MNDKYYALRYAYIYTALVAAILLAPLFLYTTHTKGIYDAKNEIELKKRAYLILKIMQEHNVDKEYFEYPRFKTFKSGLYDLQQKKIFSLIKKPIKYFKEGYQVDDGDAYYILELPKGRYFNAKYLVVNNELSYYEVYERALFILLSIVMLIFILSIFFLNRFAQPFKDVNKKLDHFIKDSIHEINTPIAVMNINIELYTRKHGTNKYMQRIKASAKTLSNIYNDMEYLIKQDRHDYEKEHIDMAKFLQERIEYFLEVALMKNIKLLGNIQEEIFLSMNPKQFQRLVDNNISNAIKYSYEESVVEVSLQMQEDGSCLLSFRDYGIGIEDVDKIFNRYYRENRQTGGFGIGLNIVNSIIKKANIEICIDSALKKGTTFTYKFPKNIIFIEK